MDNVQYASVNTSWYSKPSKDASPCLTISLYSAQWHWILLVLYVQRDWREHISITHLQRISAQHPEKLISEGSSWTLDGNFRRVWPQDHALGPPCNIKTNPNCIFFTLKACGSNGLYYSRQHGPQCQTTKKTLIHHSHRKKKSIYSKPYCFSSHPTDLYRTYAPVSRPISSQAQDELSPNGAMF